MGSSFQLALWAAIYPNAPRDRYLFALGGSSGTTTTTKHAVSPIVEIVLGAILLLLVLVFCSGRDQRDTARVARRREAKARSPYRR